MTMDDPGSKAMTDLATFRHYAWTFLAVECLEIARLKDAIHRNPDKSWPAEFKAQLFAVIHDGAMTERDYHLLTNHEFDTPEEFQDWLSEVWSFLYEDGPDPT